MKMTANDLKKLGIIDKIIKEPENGAQNDFERIVEDIKKYLTKNIKELEKLSEEGLLEQRYQKFRNM